MVYIYYKIPLNIVNENPLTTATTENAAIIWADSQAYNDVSAFHCAVLGIVDHSWL